MVNAALANAPETNNAEALDGLEGGEDEGEEEEVTAADEIVDP